jgi:hypothetical protein
MDPVMKNQTMESRALPESLHELDRSMERRRSEADRHRPFACWSWRRSASLLSILATLLSSATAQTEPLIVKDNVEGSFVNLATFPIRPMILVPASTTCAQIPVDQLWVVNHLDSTVEVFSGITQTGPQAVYAVPWNPVSIAYWNGEDHVAGNADDRVLVVCRGTWAVVELDPCTGDVKQLYQKRKNGIDIEPIGDMAEPGDIVINNTTNQAFVSCSGADAVIQIDLLTKQIVQTFNASNPSATPHLQCKNPLFLSLYGDEVLVAPMTSGNNSIWEPLLDPVHADGCGGAVEKANSLHGGYRVVDLVAQGGPTLPDEDLWAIQPYSSTSPGSVRVVAKGMGTLLFAQGYNSQAPAGQQRFWQLNTQALNTGAQGEPNVTGAFSASRVTTLNALPVAGSPPVTPTTTDFHLLDPTGLPGEAYPVDHSIGMPFGLTFEPVTGNALITGLLTNNVAALDPAGNKLSDWSLGSGAIPRQVLLRVVGESTFAYVYCWGTKQIRVFRKTSPTWSVAEMGYHYELRFDPTPAKIAEGRKLFFDGKFSKLHNLSCASCHVEAGTDMLAWNLSNLPLTGSGSNTTVQDDKGGMVTQTLVSLARQARFHWRAERILDHFNEFAFPGLLGNVDATTVPPGSLSAQRIDQFKAFVFSLTSPANPHENRERLVEGQAVDGQHHFLDNAQFRNGHRCADCHMPPVGTASDIVADSPQIGFERRAHLKPAPFVEMWRKEQGLVDLCFPGSPNSSNISRAFLGAGLTHTGEFDLISFVDTVFAGGDPTTAPLLKAETVDFLRQWDQGLAPAVHFAFFLDYTAMLTPTRVTAELDTYLLNQASATNRACDIAVFGNSPVARRWFYNRRDGKFYAENGTSTRVLVDFKNAASAASESNVFIGLPVGMGERFAVDYDMDGQYNTSAGEITGNNAWDASQPGWSGSVPVLSVGPTATPLNTRVTRVNLTANQPSQVKVRIRAANVIGGAAWWEFGPESGFPTNVASTNDSELAIATIPGNYSKVHSILLSNLVPSSVGNFPTWSQQDVQYEYQVQLLNPNGTSAWLPVTPLTFVMPHFIVPSFHFDPFKLYEDYQILNEHVIQSSSMTLSAGTSGSNRHVKVDFVFAYRMGAHLDAANKPVLVPAENRIVVGHVLRQRGSSTIAIPPRVSPMNPNDLPWVNLAMKTGKTTSVQLLTRTDYTVSSQPSAILQVDGSGAGLGVPFVFGIDRSHPDGSHSIEFDVENVQAGDVIRFVVDAVVEVPLASAGQTDEWPAMYGQVSPTAPLLLIPSYVPSLFSTVPPDTNNGKAGFTQWCFPCATNAEKVSTPQQTVL